MVTRKGILENALCKKVSDEAINNANNHWGGPEWVEGEPDPEESAGELLLKAFVWQISPQGYDYWQEIHEQLEENNL